MTIDIKAYKKSLKSLDDKELKSKLADLSKIESKDTRDELRAVLNIEIQKRKLNALAVKRAKKDAEMEKKANAVFVDALTKFYNKECLKQHYAGKGNEFLGQMLIYIVESENYDEAVMELVDKKLRKPMQGIEINIPDTITTAPHEGGNGSSELSSH